MSDHLVKILAERGVASRRGAEKMIREGLVTVDGKVQAQPGTLVDARTQDIRIDGRRLPPRPKPVHLVLHKPRGVITTRSDPEGRRTVFDLLEQPAPGISAVGRLDFNTEGVLLLSNDGELAYRLAHPSYGVTKSYLVKVSGTPDAKKLARLARGVPLEDGPTGPALVEIVVSAGPSSWLLLTLAEGRNRIVRRLVDHIGHRVLKLKRIGFGGITLRGIEPGDTRSMSDGELEHLRRMVRKPGPKELTVTRQVRLAVAEALRLPAPPPEERGAPRHRDEEGRPYRKRGWARPKPKARRALGKKTTKGRGGKR
jgi:23S rRNA pseudouridine2605 synthase